MPGFPELFIILLVLVVVFGPSKLADLGGTLGRSVRGFRKELHTDDEQTLVAPASDQPSAAGQNRRCTTCAGALSERDKFCASCGALAGAVAH